MKDDRVADVAAAGAEVEGDAPELSTHERTHQLLWSQSQHCSILTSQLEGVISLSISQG